MTIRTATYIGTVALLSQMFLLQGCGSNNPSTTSAGGTTGTTPTGGTITTGGATVAPATGGVITTGGAAPTTGGVITTGGAAPTTGGAITTGGAVPATGGIISTGGATVAPATGGTISTGGATVAPAMGGTISTGGATVAPAMGGTIDAGGSTVTDDGGTSAFQPLCSALATAAGVSPTKGGICAAADPQLCYKTCGPKSVGFKSETCTGGSYVEQSGCSFPPGDYSCYKVPTAIDATCPTTAAPQANTACTVLDCVPCSLNGNYLDSTGATKQGYCVCPATTAGTPGKWTCASAAAWPCPQSQGC